MLNMELLPKKGIPSDRRNFQLFVVNGSPKRSKFKKLKNYLLHLEAECFHWPHKQVNLWENGRMKNYTSE